VRNHEEGVLEQLRRVVRLLSVLALRGLTQRERILTLSSAGFQPKEIAELIGTTPNTVSVCLTQLRRASRKRQDAAAGGDA
jgi:DNA-binding CsgD family transcriptional regulator